jgi:RNA polymerase Rpb4
MESSHHEYGRKEVKRDKDDEGEAEVEGEDEEELQNSSLLLSNLAVLELLRPRVERRERAATATVTLSCQRDSSQIAATGNNDTLERTTTLRRRKQNKVRHRDWIEDQVVQYIQQTATMDLHSVKNTIPLRSVLLRRKRPKLSQKEVSSGLDPVATLHSDCTTQTTSAIETEIRTSGFHLTEAEMIQILNHSPREMVDLHLLIDQIHDRLKVPEQEDLLRIIDHSRTLPSRTLQAAEQVVHEHFESPMIPKQNVVTASIGTITTHLELDNSNNMQNKADVDGNTRIQNGGIGVHSTQYTCTTTPTNTLNDISQQNIIMKHSLSSSS